MSGSIRSIMSGTLTSTPGRPPITYPPFSPPQELIVDPAPAWRMWIASVIDLLCAIGVGALTTGLELLIRRTSFQSSFRSTSDIAAEWLTQHSGAVLHGFVAAVIYGLTVTMWREGQTPGRSVAGVVLVRVSGRPFNLWVRLLRLVGLGFSLGALGLGFFWVYFDPNARSFHDVLAGTVSVRKRIKGVESSSGE